MKTSDPGSEDPDEVATSASPCGASGASPATLAIVRSSTARGGKSKQEPFFILRRELRRLVPYSMQHILRLEKRNTFPRRVPIGINRVAWVRSEVMAWIEQRINSR